MLKFLLIFFLTATKAFALGEAVRSVDAFDADKVEFAGNGYECNAAANTDTNCDWTLPEQLLLTGIQIIPDGTQLWDDYAKFQIVSGSTVVSEFASKWFFVSGTSQQTVNLPIPANIPSGFKIRVKYSSNAPLGVVKLKFNLYLYRPKL